MSEYGVWGRDVDLWRALGEREQRTLRGKVRGCWEEEAEDSGGREQEILGGEAQEFPTDPIP